MGVMVYSGVDKPSPGAKETGKPTGLGTSASTTSHPETEGGNGLGFRV